MNKIASILIIFFALAATSACTAEKKELGVCEDPMVLDLHSGLLNGAAPTLDQTAIKNFLPCFTAATEEGKVANHRGGVFFRNHDLYFYTFKDFIEVRENFTGTVQPPILGAPAKDVGKLLNIDITPYEVRSYSLYPMDYGCIGVRVYDGNKVREVRVHDRPCVTAADVYYHKLPSSKRSWEYQEKKLE